MQRKHFVRTRKRLMYCQELSASLPSLSLPLLASLSTTPVSDPRLHSPRKGTEKRYPMNLNLISTQFIPNLPCSPSSPSLCHPDYRNL